MFWFQISDTGSSKVAHLAGLDSGSLPGDSDKLSKSPERKGYDCRYYPTMVKSYNAE